MARQLNDALELERENDDLRETLRIIKTELARIRIEYFDDSKPLDSKAVDEVDEELEGVVLTIENALF
jgi:hypothetical protein